ncbi:MAG: type VI secretion system contractile sheath large subunit [Acidobacteria bacterium]|nr:type VI secretion system contractile sheath large subunit [Acidobacteriota bacterium]
MPKTAFADVQLEVDPLQPQREPLPEAVDRDTPFRILVLGDFSGRASRGVTGAGPRKPVSVDRDNFTDVLESLNVELHLPVAGGAPLEFTFLELDDFQPDRLFQRLPLFRKLRDLREQLEDPATFASAAGELGVAATPARAPEPPPPSPPPRAFTGGGSFLDQALEATETGGAGPARSIDPLAQYVRALVTPHLVPKPDAKKKEILEQLDQATGAVLRQLMHHPLFQELEANWRALYFLIRELETGPKLKVFLLDISRRELEADVSAASDLRSTALYRILVEQTVRTPGAHPWAALVGCFTFGPPMADLNLLGRLGLLARQARAPLLAAASPRLAGCESLAQTPYPEDWKLSADREGWDLIRSLPEARHIGLVLPRFLLRLPYGKHTVPAEQFAFEEMPPVPVHEEYLWGNSAFVCACLLGQTFSEFGWGMQPGEILTLRGLPMHVYKQDGEAKVTPCGETFLTETALEKMHELGLMVLMSYANSDQVRLAGFRSAAQPQAALAGRWQGR